MEREQTYNYDDYRQDVLAEQAYQELLALCPHSNSTLESEDDEAEWRRCLQCGEEFSRCKWF